MPRQTRPPEGHFAERLDRLFRTAHPKDRGPYTPAEVAEAINQAAGDKVVSGTYLWLLRTGQRDNPTMKHLIAIARFFGVPPTYFFPDDAMQADAVPADLAAALSDDNVREMALRAAGLSDRSLQAITDMIDSARTVEGLPDDAVLPVDRSHSRQLNLLDVEQLMTDSGFPQLRVSGKPRDTAPPSRATHGAIPHA